MKVFRKFLILSHRYLGIVACLLAVMWFASGIVMMYKGGMPKVSPERRLERMNELDLAKVKFTPAEAVRQADIETGGDGVWQGPAPEVRLMMLRDRPVYHIGDVDPIVLYADDGKILDVVSKEEGRRIAGEFLRAPLHTVRYLESLDRVDQWTLQEQLPLHHYEVEDGKGTQAYVNIYTGEVLMVTDRQSRMWAWLGTIPHWFYFTGIRTHQSFWTNTVVYTGWGVCALAVLGMVLGVTLFRKPKPFQLKKAIPYSGGLRWHYVAGMVFGLFTVTWAFSGVLSMEPFAWTHAQGLEVRPEAFQGGEMDLKAFGKWDREAWSKIADGRELKQITMRRLYGQHYYDAEFAPPAGLADAVDHKDRERLHQPYYITQREHQNRDLIAADTMQPREEPFTKEAVVERLSAALPGETVTEAEVLDKYDSYYYSRANQMILPILRVKFADPAETWFYVDPNDSQVLATVHRFSRMERWLYNGLHSFDFAFLYDKRPLWDLAMLALALGGLVTATIGAWLGLRRVLRGAARFATTILH